MTGVRKTVDSLFFMKVEIDDSRANNSVKDIVSMGVLSLNRTDRLRMIEFDKSVSNVVSETLTNFYEKKHISSAGKYHGAVEFKLQGHPFDCLGLKSVESHQLVCDVLQSLTFSAGYNILSTIKVSDKITSKSSFIMTKSSRSENGKTENKKQSQEINNWIERYASISFSEKNKLRFINFSPETTMRVMKMVTEAFHPGMVLRAS